MIFGYACFMISGSIETNVDLFAVSASSFVLLFLLLLLLLRLFFLLSLLSSSFFLSLPFYE